MQQRDHADTEYHYLLSLVDYDGIAAVIWPLMNLVILPLL